MLLLCTNVSSKMFNFVATDATVKCYNISCLTSSFVATDLDESFHVIIKSFLLSLHSHSWKTSRRLVKFTSSADTRLLSVKRFCALKQTGVSFTSWTVRHVSTDTWSHTHPAAADTEPVQSRRWEVLVWLVGAEVSDRKRFLDVCSITHVLSGCVSFSSYQVLVWSVSEGFNSNVDGGWRGRSDFTSDASCGCSVGWSRRFFFFFYCFRLTSHLLLSGNRITSPLRHNLTSLFLFSTLSRNNLTASPPPHPAPSVSPPSSSESSPRWQILHVSPPSPCFTVTPPPASWPPLVSPPSEI